MARFLVLDIEAIRDPDVWSPPSTDPPSIINAGIVGGASGITGTVQSPPRDVFAPPFAWRPIVIGFVLLDGTRVLRLGTIEGSGDPNDRERAILEKFASGRAKDSPTIVTWNGRRFDLPVLTLRSLRYGIGHSWYYQSRDTRYRFSEAGHCDLADCMSDYGSTASLGLDGVARLIGLPGKYGAFDGAGVAEAFADGKHAEIAAYCLSDSVQTAFAFLRWNLLKGELSVDAYRTAARSLLDACAADPRLADFVTRIDRRVLLLEPGAEAAA